MAKTKTGATERSERAWALFQSDRDQKQPRHLLALQPQASYLASLNSGALFSSSMCSVRCGLHGEKQLF